MAKLDVQGFDDLLGGLDALAAGIGGIADEALNNAAPEMAESLRNGIRQAANRGYATGELAGSVVPTKARENQYGHFVAVSVNGTDKRGTGNGEKLAYLEYGTSRQAPHPVMADAVRRAEAGCMEKIQDTIDKYIDRN